MTFTEKHDKISIGWLVLWPQQQTHLNTMKTGRAPRTIASLDENILLNLCLGRNIVLEINFGITIVEKEKRGMRRMNQSLMKTRG